MKTVLIVCQANTARSAMAQVLLERLLAERAPGLPVRVRSAGIAPWARDGMLVSLDAILVLRELGVDVAATGFRSTDLRQHPELVTEADLVVTMTVRQKEQIARMPEARGRRLLTLRELAGEAGDIGDPGGLGEDVFRACRDEIVRCLGRCLDRLVGALDPSC